MQARYSLVDALLQVNTKSAVEAALEHCLDTLHLNHNDNQGMRTIIPALYIRLGRDQECYDFLHRWLVNTDGEYIFGDPRFPVKKQYAFKTFDGFVKEVFFMLLQLVSLVLFKVRMLIDVRKFQNAPVGMHGEIKYVSDIIAKERRVFEAGGAEKLCEDLRKVVADLCVGVPSRMGVFGRRCSSLGNVLITGTHSHMMGSEEEVKVALQKCYNSWAETPGAFDVFQEMAGDPEVLGRILAIR
jgi:hypothetical protein